MLEIKEPVGLPPPLSVGTKDVPDTELTEVMTVGYRLCGTLKMFVESGCDVIMKDSERAFEAMEWLRVQERKYRCSLILDGEDHTVLNWKYDSKYLYIYENTKSIYRLERCLIQFLFKFRSPRIF